MMQIVFGMKGKKEHATFDYVTCQQCAKPQGILYNMQNLY